MITPELPVARAPLFHSSLVIFFNMIVVQKRFVDSWKKDAVIVQTIQANIQIQAMLCTRGHAVSKSWILVLYRKFGQNFVGCRVHPMLGIPIVKEKNARKKKENHAHDSVALMQRRFRLECAN